MTASSLCCSTRIFCSSLCAFEDPNSTPSGHDHRRPPAWFQETEEERKEQQLGFLGFDHRQQILGRALVVERSREWRIGKNKSVFFGLLRVVLGKTVAVDGWPGFQSRAAACSYCRCGAWCYRNQSRGRGFGENACGACRRAEFPGGDRAGIPRPRPETLLCRMQGRR